MCVKWWRKKHKLHWLKIDWFGFSNATCSHFSKGFFFVGFVRVFGTFLFFWFAGWLLVTADQTKCEKRVLNPWALFYKLTFLAWKTVPYHIFTIWWNVCVYAAKHCAKESQEMWQTPHSKWTTVKERVRENAKEKWKRQSVMRMPYAKLDGRRAKQCRHGGEGEMLVPHTHTLSSINNIHVFLLNAINCVALKWFLNSITNQLSYLIVMCHNFTFDIQHSNISLNNCCTSYAFGLFSFNNFINWIFDDMRMR